MIGILFVSSLARSFAAERQPSMSGRFRSRITRSNGFRARSVQRGDARKIVLDLVAFLLPEIHPDRVRDVEVVSTIAMRSGRRVRLSKSPVM